MNCSRPKWPFKTPKVGIRIKTWPFADNRKYICVYIYIKTFYTGGILKALTAHRKELYCLHRHGRQDGKFFARYFVLLHCRESKPFKVCMNTKHLMMFRQLRSGFQSINKTFFRRRFSTLPDKITSRYIHFCKILYICIFFKHVLFARFFEVFNFLRQKSLHNVFTVWKRLFYYNYFLKMLILDFLFFILRPTV